MPWGGHPKWAGPLTTSLRRLWVSGYLPRAMADREQGRRPENRPEGDDSDPGLASRREGGLNCHKRRHSQTSVACINTKRGGSPKTPLCEGKGPENPGVVAPFAVAGCRGNRKRAVDRRFPLLFNDWCLVVSAQTTVEAPQFLGVSMMIPQVQLLDKLTRPLCATDAGVVSCVRPVLVQGRLHARCRAFVRQGGRCLCCAVEWGFRRCCSSTVMTSP